MGSSTSNTNSSQFSNGSYAGTATNAPSYAPQANALQDILGQVPGALSQGQSAQLPSNYVAGLTGQQLGLGQTEYNSGLGAANTASGLVGTGSSAATTGYGGAGSALSSLLGYNPSATNNAGAVNSFANQYVAGQNIPAQVQQAMAGANQEANEVSLPGINQAMTASGNQNSSRNALSQGLVQSNLANTAANLGSSMEGQAYATGSQLGESALQSNNSNALSALTGALSGGTALGSSGAYGSTLGTNNLASALGLSTTGAQTSQTNSQDILSNALQQYEYGEAAPFAPLAAAMGIAGSTNWGQTTTGGGTQEANTLGNSTTTSTPSLLSMLGSGLGFLGAL